MAIMSEPSKGRAKLTLRDLEAIQVPETVAPLAPRRQTGAVEAVGDAPRPRLDPGSYLPEGVSPEVAALLSKPSREAAEKAALEREEQERIRLEAERARLEAERVAAERERLAMEAAVAEAQARQAAEDAGRARQVRVALSAFAIVIVGLVAALMLILNRPPALDPTPYAVAAPSLQTPQDRQVDLALREIPAPPAPVVAPTDAPSRGGGGSGPARPRPSVRRTDLF
jgi:hypothetical protein